MHVKGERWRGGITAPSCSLTADLYLSSIGPSQVPATVYVGSVCNTMNTLWYLLV